MRVLVTRHQAAAERVAAALAERGYEPFVEPLLDIVDTDTAVDLQGVQAVLATSGNGVAALARRVTERDVPVYAVGDTTAGVARRCGFTRVESAGGDSAALVQLVIARCDPGRGPLLRVAGGHVTGGMRAPLERAGFTVGRAVLYEALTPDALSSETVERLRTGGFDAVLFYSPRTAETFATLAAQAGVAGSCAMVDAVCLSDAVARTAGAINWRGVHVAADPDGPALLETLDALTQGAGERVSGPERLKQRQKQGRAVER